MLVTLAGVIAFACSRDAAPSKNAYGEPRGEPGALVSPLEDDASDDVLSWVDGKPIASWTDEVKRREAAIAGYLNDTDPEHAEKYGFRKGQTPRLAWEWFLNNPVGFNGVPFVLFKTILDLDPNHANPTLRKVARIWKRPSQVPFGSGAAAEAFTFDHLGVGPNPVHYTDGVARAPGTGATDQTYQTGQPWPASSAAALPFGFAFENPQTFSAMSATQLATWNARLLARRVFTNTSLLVAKLRATDKEENSYEKNNTAVGCAFVGGPAGLGAYGWGAE